jgi:hypothetical protein
VIRIGDHLREKFYLGRISFEQKENDMSDTSNTNNTSNIAIPEYDALVQECAEQGRALARMLANEGTFEALYLYCRPSEQGKGPGRLLLVRDSDPAPEGTKLVTGQALHGNVPYENYFQWVYDRARRTPILSFE